MKGRGIHDYRQAVIDLGVKGAREVATKAAPALTRLMREAFDSGRTVYGDPRPLGKDGNKLSLIKSGATRKTIRFDNFGTVLRIQLTTSYAKYLVGKYTILPQGGRTAIPFEWMRLLRALADTVLSSRKRAA